MAFGMPSSFRSCLGSLSSLVMGSRRVVLQLCSTMSSEVGSTFRTSESVLITFLKLSCLPHSSSTWNCFSNLVTARSCINNSRTTSARRSQGYAESRLRSAGLRGRKQSSELFVDSLTSGLLWFCADEPQMDLSPVSLPFLFLNVYYYVRQEHFSSSLNSIVIYGAVFILLRLCVFRDVGLTHAHIYISCPSRVINVHFTFAIKLGIAQNKNSENSSEQMLN